MAEAKEHRRLRTLAVGADTIAMLDEYIHRGGPVSKNGRLFLFGINRHRAWQIVMECGERAGLPSLVNPDTCKLRGISR